MFRKSEVMGGLLTLPGRSPKVLQEVGTEPVSPCRRVGAGSGSRAYTTQLPGGRRSCCC